MKKSGKTLRREIRVFISSTFSDMQSERNYLVKHVFPDIERRCRERNVEFTALDLRWGITEEESQSGRVVEICLDEIERTRPFFIGLVGGRYGWIPPKDASNIDVERLCERFPWIGDCFEHGLSITEMEMRYGVLDSPEDVEAHFFVRTDRSIPQRYREGDAGAEAKRRRLIDDIRKAAAEDRCTVADYRSLSQLGREVHRRLMDTLDRLFPADAAGNIYREALNATERQCEQLRRVYVPRVETHNSYLLNHGYFEHVVVYGNAGDGVSAFVANELSDMAIAGACEDGTFPLRIVRTIVGDDIASLEMLRRVFVQRLMLFNPEVEVPEMSRQLSDEIPFADILTRFPMAEYVWVIDGPEKLSNESERGLGALLSLAGTIDHFIIATSDKDVADAVGNVLGKNKVLVWLTSLGVPVRRRIVDQYLARAGKRLNERQISAIAGADVLSNVGVLRTFVDILTGFGVYEDVDEFIHSFVTVDRIEQFYERILTYLEDEYDRDAVAEVMRRLLHSGVGMTEDALFDGVVRLPLERAALLGGLGRFAVCRNGRVRLTNKMLRAAAAERYKIEGKDVRRLSELVLADCKRGREELSRLMRKSSYVEYLMWRTLLRGTPVSYSAAAGAAWSAMTAEMCRQYENLGDYRRMYRLMRHLGYMSLMGDDLYEAVRLVAVLKTNGYKPLQMFSSWDLIVAHYIMGSASILPISLVMLMRLNADEEKELYGQLQRKWLPKSVKKGLSRNLTYSVDNICRQWDEADLEDIPALLAVNTQVVSANMLWKFGDNQPTMLYNKVSQVLSKVKGDDGDMQALRLSAAMLALRLNLPGEYRLHIGWLQRAELVPAVRNELLYPAALAALLFDNDRLEARKLAMAYIGARRDAVNEFMADKLNCEVMQIVVAEADGKLADGVAALVKRYPQGDSASVAYKVGSVLHNMKQYAMAQAIVEALLQLELDKRDRCELLYWLSDLNRMVGRKDEAMEALDRLEALQPAEADFSRWRVVVHRADIVMDGDDTEHYEKCCRAIIECADQYDQTHAEYLRFIGHSRLALVAESRYNDVRTDPDARPHYVRECVDELKKCLEYKKMSEREYADIWGRYVRAMVDLDRCDSVPESELHQLLEHTEATSRDNNLRQMTSLRTALGCLYVRLGMQEKFDALVKEYPRMVCAERMTQTIAAAYRIHADDDNARLSYMSTIYAVLESWLDGERYVGERRYPLSEHLGDLLETIDSRTLEVMFEADVEEYPSADKIFKALIWIRLNMIQGNKEEADRLTAALDRVLASRRWDDREYLRYLRMNLDISGYYNVNIFDPKAAIAECYQELLQRASSTSGYSAAMTDLYSRAMRDGDVAREAVQQALDAEGPESPTICRLMKGYSETVQLGNLDEWAPMLYFVMTLVEQVPAGAPIYDLIADDAVDITEHIGDYLHYTWRWPGREMWDVFAKLLAHCGRPHGRYMAWMGLHAMGSGDEAKEYFRQWTDANGDNDPMVEMAYVSRLEYSDDLPEIRRRLEALTSKVNKDNSLDNTYQRMLIEQAYLRGYDGDYAGALESFGRLCEAEGYPNDCYNTHISTEFPLCMAVMARDNDRFLALIDNIDPSRMRDMMLCAYYLANDNEASARRQYDNPSQDEPPADATEEWRELHAATALRHIEMARYDSRHGTGEERRRLNEAEKILDLYPGRLLYLRNYLQKVKDEL